MDKKAVRKIIKEKTQRIVKLGNEVAKDYKPESMHQFRVEIKRFRSFLRLMANHKHKENKLPAKFKRLYDTAGIIREAQLEQKRLTELALHLPSYATHLAMLEKKHVGNWEKHYKKELLKQFKEKTGQYKVHELNAEALPGFFYEHARYLQHLCKGSPEDEDVHTIRKRVKDMLYNAKFTELKCTEAFSLLKSLPLKTLDNISDRLGNYNDRRIMLEHLCAFSSATMDKSEKETLKKFCAKETKALHTHKTKMLDEVKKLALSISTGAEKAL